MDFRNKNYYLICKNGLNDDIVKYIKRYFHCKVRCHQYLYDDVYYTRCISVDKGEDTLRVLAFLEDARIAYQQVTEQPTVVSYYKFSWTSPERKQYELEMANKAKELEAQLKKSNKLKKTTI